VAAVAAAITQVAIPNMALAVVHHDWGIGGQILKMMTSARMNAASWCASMVCHSPFNRIIAVRKWK